MGVLPWHPQILPDQLTLSQPRGADYAHQTILATTDFQTFRRPCELTKNLIIQLRAEQLQKLLHK